MCKFILQIEVDSIDEAERILASLRHSAAPAVVQQVVEQLPFSDPAGLSDEESPAKKYFPETTNTATTAESAPKRRGRPSKSAAAPAATDESTKSGATDLPVNHSSADSAPEQPQTHTVDDVREALRSVQAGGIGDVPRQLALLQKYGANRVTELKPEKYAAFIADCKAA